MKAAYYSQFTQPIIVTELPDPTPTSHGVVIRVEATGICRSDWHGWMGHDADISLPHVPGHELAGVVVEVGCDVTQWRQGDRVTVPFVCGCGECFECRSGNHQVCDHQFQPGFTHWGSFAQYVAIHFADINLVRLPDEMSFVTAASLGCRFSTAYRAIVAQGIVTTGQWVAVHGCGGVGCSAIMIASALGAQVIAIDIAPDKLTFAKTIGATTTINANNVDSVSQAVKEISTGGVHVSIDALGSLTTCHNSIASLKKRGKHIQVGLMLADESRPAIPMDSIIANELEILGSHGIQAHAYPPMLELIQSGKLQPDQLIGETVTLDEGIKRLMTLDQFNGLGMTVIDSF